MNFKHKNNSKKHAKFTVAFDGILPCNVETFWDQSQFNECLTIPQVIKDHAHKYEQQIYVFDRGVNKRSIFDEL